MRIATGWATLGSRTSDDDYGGILKMLCKPLLDCFRDFYADTALCGGRIGLPVLGEPLDEAVGAGALAIDDAYPKQVPALDLALKSLGARLHGAGVRPGKTYHHSTLIKATTYLQNQLVKQGFLSAQVKLTGAEYHADTNRADIHFTVKPGPTTHVEVEGAHLFSWTRKSLLPVYQGIGVDDASRPVALHPLDGAA